MTFANIMTIDLKSKMELAGFSPTGTTVFLLQCCLVKFKIAGLGWLQITDGTVYK